LIPLPPYMILSAIIAGTALMVLLPLIVFYLPEKIY
jgi:hypothetical protein